MQPFLRDSFDRPGDCRNQRNEKAGPKSRKGLLPKALKSLKDGGWLLPKALLVAETDALEPLEAPGFELVDDRDYGETRVRFLTLSSQS